jgi:hypothetical protein
MIETQAYLQFMHALPLFNGFAIALDTAEFLGVSAIIDDGLEIAKVPGV